MTPGGCCGGVSPLGSEQVNTELGIVLGSALSSCSACGTLQSARGRKAVLVPGCRQDVQENLESSSLTGMGRLFRDLGCQEKQSGMSPQSYLKLTDLSFSLSLFVEL